MKKTFIFCIILAMVFSIYGCSRSQNISESSDTDSNLIPETEDTSDSVLFTDTSAAPTKPAVTDASKKTDTKITEIGSPKYIRQDVIHLVQTALEKDKVKAAGKDMSYFDSYKTGTELKIKDLDRYTFASSETDFLTELKEMDEKFQDTHIYLLDIDNDGSDELAISQYGGGTMGNVDFIVLKKDKNGIYSETVYPNESFLSLSETLSFIKVGGRNYFLVKYVDFSDKIFSGISIYSFCSGKIVECADLSLYTDETYAIEREPVDPQYTDYLKSININDSIAVTVQENVKSGSAENPESGNYSADINNDGNNETLIKSYNGTTVYYRPSYLDFKTNSGNPEFDSDPLKAITGTSFDEQGHEKFLQQLWCDKFQGKNIIAVLYRNKIDPVYHLDAYLLDGVKSKKVGQITATPVKNIKTRYCSISD